SSWRIAMSAISDLPPRTWRHWWLAWPKWFRIGVLAAVVVLAFFVAVAVRIRIGLFEDAEIRRLHRDGGMALYPRSDLQPEPFPGTYLIMDGLGGRSARNVHAVILPKRLEGKIEHVLAAFPHVKFVVLTDLVVERNQHFFQPFCRMMAQEHDTSKP